MTQGWKPVLESFSLYYSFLLLAVFLGNKRRFAKRLMDYLNEKTLSFKYSGFGKVKDLIPLKQSSVNFDFLQQALSSTKLDIVYTDKQKGVIKLKEPFHLFKNTSAAIININTNQAELTLYPFGGRKHKRTNLLAEDLRNLIVTLKI